MTLDEGVAIVAVHLGVVEEEKIDNMSYVFFTQVLSELGHKLIYDAVVNYAGNSFCEKSWDMIMQNYPMKNHDKARNAAKSIADLFRKNAGKVEKRVVPRPKRKEAKGNEDRGNDEGSGNKAE